MTTRSCRRHRRSRGLGRRVLRVRSRRRARDRDAAAGAAGARVDVPHDEAGRARRGDGRAAGASRGSVKGAKQQAALELLRTHPGGHAPGPREAGRQHGDGAQPREARRPAAARRDRAPRSVRRRDRRGRRVDDDVGERRRADADRGAGAGAATRSGRWRTPERSGSALLHGVTGSGKTEIYLRLAERVLAAGRRVLILVPEIALTPSVAGQVRRRFGRASRFSTAGSAAGERHDQWHRIRRGDVDVVVGTRSAVFAPLERARSHRRRRGARRRLQAGGSAAVPRARRRGRPRPHGGRARRPRERDAVARIGGERASRPLRSRDADAPRARPAAGRGRGRGHASASTPRSGPTSRSAGRCSRRSTIGSRSASRRSCC